MRLALLLVLVIAFAARAYRLEIPTLTGDEWFSFRNTQEGPLWILSQARVFEPHPLLYYLGLWAWVIPTGTSEWALRYPSVLFGVLTCAAVWRLGRDAASPAVGLGAAVLAAVNPYQVAQSQNARNYAMVAALSTVATGLLLVASRRGGKAWTRYAIGLLLALHTHLNAILVALAHALWLLIRGQPIPREAWRAAGLVALLFLPWLIYSAPVLLAYHGFFPDPIGPLDVAMRTLGTFTFGQHEAPRRLFVGLIGLLAAVGAFAAIQSAAKDLPIRRSLGGALVLLCAVVPIASTAAFFLVRPMFEERYVIVAAPALLVLVAAGAAALARSRPVYTTAVVTAALAITLPFLQRYYPAAESSRPDWRGLASWIDATERPGDLVLITGQGVADAYNYYRKADATVRVAADEATLAVELPTLPRGVFHLPYWDSRPDTQAHERLTMMGFPAETRWFRNQRAQFFDLKQPTDRPPIPIGARWGPIHLDLATVAPASLRGGEPLRVELHWRTTGPAPDLKISVRVLEPGTLRTLAQVDRAPRDGLRPFPTLQPGPTLRDGHALFAPTAPPGVYPIGLLLYMPEDGRAMAPDGVTAPPALPELVTLGTIGITP